MPSLSEGVGKSEFLLRNIFKIDDEPNFTDLPHTCLCQKEHPATVLSRQVSAKSRELADEKKRTDQLLHRMLPRSVAEQLKQKKQVEPEFYASATIYFSDIVGFTDMSARSSPHQVVDLLNMLYR